MGDFVANPVTIRAPATSANLGPGFDAFGLALAVYDLVEAQVTDARLQVDVDGESADLLSRGESHLVVRSMRATFDALGVPQPGLRLRCHNVIPQGRGLGSSASAIVCGIKLADGLLGGGAATDEVALALATRLEGHPDNVAACLSGGFTIAWLEDNGPRLLRLDVHPSLRPVILIPPLALSTDVARTMLPEEVSHGAASANAGRAALLVAAITEAPVHLLAATRDELHQEFRRSGMPDSLALVDEMREAGVAAVVSGAGPAVLALGTAGDPVDVTRWTPPRWRAVEVEVDSAGAEVW